MTDRTRHQDDLQIRRLLKEGDPADDGRDPDAVELSRWQRQALAASETGTEPASWRWRLLPLATMATAAVVAVIFGLLPKTPVKVQEPTTITRTVPADAGVTTPEAGPVSPVVTQDGVSPSEQPSVSVSSSPSPPADVTVTARTVHFTAPGGTRVIWTLNPELQLPTPGGSI